MTKTSFKAALLVAVIFSLLAGCVHVTKEEKVVEPVAVPVAPR